jgi:hypothetical protein
VAQIELGSIAWSVTRTVTSDPEGAQDDPEELEADDSDEPPDGVDPEELEADDSDEPPDGVDPDPHAALTSRTNTTSAASLTMTPSISRRRAARNGVPLTGSPIP